MPLAEFPFVDLLILPDGSGRFKGYPGNEPGAEQRLIPVPADCEDEVRELQKKLPEAFMTRDQLDADESRFIPKAIRYEYKGVFYRVADLHDATGQNWFLRRLPTVVSSLDALRMPLFLANWLRKAENRYGLILICGAQESGKTYSAGGYIRERLTLFGGHAVTYEIPPELPLAGTWGEYGQCFQTAILSESQLAKRIEDAHRLASPNIIFIGEIRTKYAATEALRIALGSNQQVVIATIHGLDIITALERLLNWAREIDGENARQNLANSLLAIFFQNLVMEKETVRDKESGEEKETIRRRLEVPEFLLLPFLEKAKAARAVLRRGELHLLKEEIGRQWNSMKNYGEPFPPDTR